MPYAALPEKLSDPPAQIGELRDAVANNAVSNVAVMEVPSLMRRVPEELVEPQPYNLKIADPPAQMRAVPEKLMVMDEPRDVTEYDDPKLLSDPLPIAYCIWVVPGPVELT